MRKYYMKYILLCIISFLCISNGCSRKHENKIKKTVTVQELDCIHFNGSKSFLHLYIDKKSGELTIRLTSNDTDFGMTRLATLKVHDYSWGSRCSRNSERIYGKWLGSAFFGGGNFAERGTLFKKKIIVFETNPNFGDVWKGEIRIKDWETMREYYKSGKYSQGYADIGREEIQSLDWKAKIEYYKGKALVSKWKREELAEGLSKFPEAYPGLNSVTVEVTAKKIKEFKRPKYIPEKEFKPPKYPADLIIANKKFSEPSGNRALDGYEKGKLSFTVRNQGKGIAYDVKLNVKPIKAEGLKFGDKFSVGNISPGESKEVKVALEAFHNVPNQEAKLRIEASERNGFDATPIVFAFPTRTFKPPKFKLIDLAMDDDKKGDSSGNNNGVIDLGESIEVTLLVQNKGEGKGEDVNAEIHLEGEGHNLFYGSQKHKFSLNTMVAGESKKIKFFFTINKRYEKKGIPLNITLSESKGKYGNEFSRKLPVGSLLKREEKFIVSERAIKPKVYPKPSSVSVDVDTPPGNSRTELKNGLCVIFGIEEYKRGPKASFAAHDATVFYDYAKNVFGIPKSNIYLFINENATKAEFDKVFSKRWLARRIVPGKTDIIFYFSGHGIPDIKTHKPYLIPYDGDSNYTNTLYSLSKIYSCLSGLGARSVTIFLDACFSGESRDGGMLLAYAKATIPVVEEPVKYGKSLLVFTAGSRISSSSPQKKHGLFTYYLLKGLGGKADLNRDKIIKASEIANYLRENVRREANLMDREQTPELDGVDKERIIIKLKWVDRGQNLSE